MRQANWTGLFLALASSLCVTPVLRAWPAQAGNLANITLVQNQVQFRPSERNNWGLATVGTPVNNGDWTRTGALSRAEIRYKDDSVVRLASTCILQHLDPDRRILHLILGKLWVKVHKGGGGLHISTPSVLAATIGTEFIIEVLSDQSTQLTVLEGSVLIFPPNIAPIAVEQGIARVKQGQQPPPPGGQQDPGGKRPELNETVSLGANTSSSPPPAQPVVVAAGQGAIARPDTPLHAAFSVDLSVVRTGDAPLLPPTSVLALPSPQVIAPPPRPPQDTAAAATTLQMHSQANDPKLLQGSPTSGSVRVFVNIKTGR